MVTTVLAVWGALLSTIVVVRDLLRSGPRARVRAGYTAWSRLPDVQPFVLAGTISNHGRESIYLARAALDVRRFEMSTQSPLGAPLPVELKPGQSYTASFDADQVWPMSTYGPFPEVRVLFYDQLGRSYASDFVPTAQPQKTADGWGLTMAERPTPLQRFRSWLTRRRPPSKTPL